jgi:hypothetical protein
MVARGLRLWAAAELDAARLRLRLLLSRGGRGETTPATERTDAPTTG